jgi:hypothetical protein
MQLGKPSLYPYARFTNRDLLNIRANVVISAEPGINARIRELDIAK